MDQHRNPYNLEVGKKYWFRYLGNPDIPGPWYKVRITRQTEMGWMWAESLDPNHGHKGTVTGTYDVKPECNEMEIVAKAQKFLESKSMAGLIPIGFPELLTQFALSVSPDLFEL